MESEHSAKMKKASENAVVLGVCAAAILIAGAALRSGGSGRPEVAVPWTTDFPAGLATARAEHKLVLLNFGGSDWCPVCQEMDRKVFGTRAFAEYASNKLVLVSIDLPQNKPQPELLRKANEKLAAEFNIDPLPATILLDANSNTLLRVEGYGGQTPAEFIATLDKAAERSAAVSTGQPQH